MTRGGVVYREDRLKTAWWDGQLAGAGRCFEARIWPAKEGREKEQDSEEYQLAKM